MPSLGRGARGVLQSSREEGCRIVLTLLLGFLWLLRHLLLLLWLVLHGQSEALRICSQEIAVTSAPEQSTAAAADAVSVMVAVVAVSRPVRREGFPWAGEAQSWCCGVESRGRGLGGSGGEHTVDVRRTTRLREHSCHG